MSDMTNESPRHGTRWTFPQILLAAFAALFAASITPLFFAGMFVTVWDLLRGAGYGSWPWMVPLAGEGVFMVLFLSDLLLVLRRKPRGRLRFAPYLFAAGSLALNAMAGHGRAAATAGHVLVTLAFFAMVIEGEEVFRKLAVADRDARVAEMMADARRYAIDVVRDRRGYWWRLRVPALLRRDIRTGRLSDEIRQAVELAVSVGRASGWRAPAMEWVTRELRLGDEAEAADAKALAAISRSAAADDSAIAPVITSPDAPEVTTKATPQIAPKAHRVVPSKASDDELAELVLALFDDGSAVTKYAVIKKVRDAAGGKASIGDKRAGDILELARRKHRAQRVVPIGDRKSS